MKTSRPVLRLRKVLQKAGMHPDDDVTGVDLSGVAGRRALVVATNHGTLKPGRPRGVWSNSPCRTTRSSTPAWRSTWRHLAGRHPVRPDIVPPRFAPRGRPLPRRPGPAGSLRELARYRRSRHVDVRHRLLRRWLGCGLGSRPFRGRRRASLGCDRPTRHRWRVPRTARTPSGHEPRRHLVRRRTSPHRGHRPSGEATRHQPHPAAPGAGTAQRWALYESTATSAAMPSLTMSLSTATSSPVRTRTPGRWSLAR